MHVLRVLLLSLTCISFCSLGIAQDVLPVNDQALEQHIASQIAPIYPPIAKAARIGGSVVFDVRIGITGKIESIKVLSGPAMLQQAAIDSLKQWTFKPFEKEGVPVTAEGRISIAFDLGKDAPTSDEEKLAQRYFPLSDECRKEVGAHSDFAKAAEVCGQAAELADQFAADRRFIEKRSAYVWAAWALVYSGDFTGARGWAEKAVDVAKRGHDDNSGNNAVYGIRAIVEAKQGDLTAADQDFNVAEDYGRKGIKWAIDEKFEHLDSYKHSLVQDLQFHAQVLKMLNRPDETQKKLDEAAKLQ